VLAGQPGARDAVLTSIIRPTCIAASSSSSNRVGGETAGKAAWKRVRMAVGKHQLPAELCNTK